jgi:hypothetical protein
VRGSFEVGGGGGNQHVCSENPCYRIPFCSLVQAYCASGPPRKGSRWFSGRITLSTKLGKLAGPATLHPLVSMRPLPRPARRARAVSAAIGRFHHPPSTEVHSKRPLQLVPLLRTTRWRLMEVTPQYVYQPHQPHQPGSHRRSSPPPDFLHRCARHARHARTTSSRLRCGAGCRGEFGRTDRVDLAAACNAGLAAVCLPLHPSRACARFDRPSTRPLSAVRRCRNG